MTTLATLQAERLQLVADIEDLRLLKQDQHSSGVPPGYIDKRLDLYRQELRDVDAEISALISPPPVLEPKTLGTPKPIHPVSLSLQKSGLPLVQGARPEGTGHHAQQVPAMKVIRPPTPTVVSQDKYRVVTQDRYRVVTPHLVVASEPIMISTSQIPSREARRGITGLMESQRDYGGGYPKPVISPVQSRPVPPIINPSDEEEEEEEEEDHSYDTFEERLFPTIRTPRAPSRKPGTLVVGSGPDVPVAPEIPVTGEEDVAANSVPDVGWFYHTDEDGVAHPAGEDCVIQ